MSNQDTGLANAISGNKPAPADGLDPNTAIPDAVRAKSAAIDQFYQDHSGPAPAAPEPIIPIAPAPAPAPAPPAAPAATQPPAPQPQPTPPVASPDAPAAAPEPGPDEGDWQHRYNSMKGRWEKSQQILSQTQEVVSELSTEVGRLTAHIQGMQPLVPPGPAPVSAVTDEDRAQYGTDLIGVMQRAAKEAVGPEVEALKRENAHLRQKVSSGSDVAIISALDSQIPNWRHINGMPEWHAWLRLRDVYSGGVRQQLLNAAKAAGDPSRVVAFFKGFIEDAAATGVQTDPLTAPLVAAPAAPQPAPRQAAVALDSLAAPGRPGPAAPGGDQPLVPAAKPIITRAQISQFYEAVRRGQYAGREADRLRDEREIFAAQNDGRVR